MIVKYNLERRPFPLNSLPQRQPLLTVLEGRLCISVQMSPIANNYLKHRNTCFPPGSCKFVFLVVEVSLAPERTQTNRTERE